MIFLENFIESGVITYGDEFREAMENGEWDLNQG